jgi:hypothetical protein
LQLQLDGCDRCAQLVRNGKQEVPLGAREVQVPPDGPESDVQDRKQEDKENTSFANYHQQASLWITWHHHFRPQRLQLQGHRSDLAVLSQEQYCPPSELKDDVHGEHSE